MNLKQPIRIRSIAVTAAILLALVFFCIGQAQASQKSSDELLLEIMDLHLELVTNETFLAQAKMLGAYLEVAQTLEEAKKVKIYAKVLDILTKIKNSERQVPEISAEPESDVLQKSTENEKIERKSVYELGAALLEIFKSDSIDNIPALPVIRTYWNRELAYSGGFLLPKRALEIGQGARYVARFSFYYEAKEKGKYGFSLVHNEANSCKLIIGGVEIFKSNGSIETGLSGRNEPATQGVCTLEKGFHRLMFYLFSEISSGYRADRDGNQAYINYYRGSSFQMKILAPGSFDAVPLTADMMLLKKE